MAQTRRGAVTGFGKGLPALPQSGLQDESPGVSTVKLVPIGQQLDELNRRVDGLAIVAGEALERLIGASLKAGETVPQADGVMGSLGTLHQSVTRAELLIGELANAI